MIRRKVRLAQPSIEDCFLEKFKMPTPKKMSVGVKDGTRKRCVLENTTNDNFNQLISLKKRPSTPPESPAKKSRISQLPAPKKTSLIPKDSDSDDSDESSGCEDTRLRNLQDNKNFLAQLDLAGATAAFNEGKRKSAPPRQDAKGLRKSEPKRETAPPPPRRASLRLRKIESDGVALPPNYKEPTLKEMLANQYRMGVRPQSSGTTGSLAQGPQPRDERKPAIPLKMVECLANGPKMDDEGDIPYELLPEGEEKRERESALDRRREEFISDLRNSVSTATIPTEIKYKDKSEKDFLEDLKKLRVSESLERKVVKERIFGMGIHPGVEKIIVAVGDKSGGVGLWDVSDDGVGEDGVHYFYPHTRPINVLRFPEWNSSSLYSCSYDGSIRKGDFEKGVFDLIFSDENFAVSAFAFTGQRSLVASDLDGGLSVVDERTGGTSAVETFQVHLKSCRCVDVHPTEEHYCVTSGTDGHVMIWDLRRMGKNPTPVVDVTQSRTVNSAYFSPVTGNRVLTTGLDDFYRVYDFSDRKKTPLFKDLGHNNNTGRWLTKFRAVWYPNREDFILSGLMGHPRQIELYSLNRVPKKLYKVHSYLEEDVLSSICCVIQGHPRLPLIVGGNASGKVYVFK